MASNCASIRDAEFSIEALKTKGGQRVAARILDNRLISNFIGDFGCGFGNYKKYMK